MKRPAAYIAVIAALAAAVLLRWSLDPLMGDTLPLVTLFGVVAVAVWLVDFRMAIGVAIVGYVACAYLFIEPRGVFELSRARNLIGLLAYLGTCGVIIGLGHAMRFARTRAQKRGELLRVTLASIGDAVIATDTQGRVERMNAAAESLTGWTASDAAGQQLDLVFRIVHEHTREPLENPASRALRAGVVVELANHTLLLAKDGSERIIDDSAAPIRDEDGRVRGCVLVFRDVTERRKADRALRRSESELADFFENASVGLHWVARDGTGVRANRNELEMLGYSRDEYIGRHIGEFYDDRSVIDDMLARLARGETLRDWPARMRCKDGSLRDVLVSSNALFEGGELVHTRCFTRDVTDARRAQLAQARLAAIVEASDDAIVSKTLEGSILSWNSGAERLFGYSASEAIGRPINLIIPPELQDEERSILQRLRRGERIDHFETVRVSKDGRRFEISLTVSPVRDSAGTVIGASKVARDVSERKRAEARLRESESDARLLQRLSAELIQQDDDRAIYLKIVDAAAEVMRSQFASVQALVVDERGDEVLDLLAARGFSAEAEKFWRRVRFDSKSTCAIAFRQRKRVVVRDVRESALIAGSADFGMYVRAGIRSVQSTPLVTRSGRLVGMISTHWSEPHEPGERDLQNFDILARQATDLLERARAEVALKEADRRKDEFLATLAHELRNPLSPVRHSLEIMKHGPADPEVVEQALRTMDRQVAQMERLIDDLLDIARITNNRLELRKQTIPLASVVQDAVDAVRPLAQSLRHEIEVSLPPHPIEISGDPARLAQVFGNLLNNACKYTPAGGRIVLDARRRGRDAVVSIKDNGIGIPRDKMTHIFEIFSQLDKSLERAQGGLGIGLSLSKQLVEMHGGTIEAHSEGLGKGSEFVVRLPIESPAEPADSPSPAEKRAASSALRRVLVVDDNRDGAESLAKLLSLSGHETRIAFDGVEAIAAAEEFRPHVILLDIGMPRMNGFEACRRIREQPWGSDVAMIALTGWGQEEDRRKSRDSGFDGHLVKPVNHAALMTLVTSLTGKQDL